MNRTLTTIILTITLAFILITSGCNAKRTGNYRKADNSAEVIAANKVNAPSESHKCGAKTKIDGKLCTRVVAAGNERCWQHR